MRWLCITTNFRNHKVGYFFAALTLKKIRSHYNIPTYHMEWNVLKMLHLNFEIKHRDVAVDKIINSSTELHHFAPTVMSMFNSLSNFNNHFYWFVPLLAIALTPLILTNRKDTLSGWVNRILWDGGELLDATCRSHGTLQLFQWDPTYRASRLLLQP